MSKRLSPKVITYHGVYSGTCGCPDDREEGASLYDVSVNSFKEQIEWLKNEGYYTAEHAGFDPKNLTITFDDGEMNNYKEAFPVLKEMGFKATFFIIVQRVGREGYMGWNEIKELVKGGMKIGSHGLTHSILTKLKDSHMEEELEASKRTLANNLDIPIEDLSIPRGFYNDKIIRKAKEIGYKRIFISERIHGFTEECMTRLAVKKDWSLRHFQRMVADKPPLTEQVFSVSKKMAKAFLKEDGYNRLRDMIVRRMV